MFDWQQEVERRRDDLIKDTQDFLRIKSLLDESEGVDGAPFGKGIKEALDFVLDKASEFEMKVKNLEGYAGFAEIGQGDESIGILCHVDVVPEGNDWLYPPYAAEIHDGKIYARGAIDDKGPSMAIIYAMKIIKDLNLKLNRRVRVIFGTDEESEWRGINYYFKREEMPTMGFAPDADFPIIISEKGIGMITLEGDVLDSDSEKATVTDFTAGQRPNMVPDIAIVKIKGNKETLEEIKKSFLLFLNNYEQGGEIEDNNVNELTIQLKGISAHGAEPQNGINAGLELINFIVSLEKYINIRDWMKWSVEYLYQENFGNKIGIAYEDEVSGFLTMNTGMINLKDGKLNIVINVRYPITNEYDKTIKVLENKAKLANLIISKSKDTKPHHVDKEHFLIKTLQKVYEEQTGNEAKLLSIGGGTYARALNVGVAFGAIFPGKAETAHQKNEYIEIEDLLKATAIYTQAIYELAK